MLTLRRIGVALLLGLFLLIGSGCNEGWHHGGGGMETAGTTGATDGPAHRQV